jgi:3-hydroxyacyl-[acyl-carrier-protein] dehydratase
MPEKESKIMGVNEIISLLPHRYPFLLVDRILEVDLEKGTITAIKNLTINESFFQGHFPQVPIMPGVLIIEALAQAGGVLVYMKGGEQKNDKIAVLMNINEAKFRTPVRPGDVLKLTCEGLHFSSKGGKIQARAFVENRLAAEAKMGFALIDVNQISSH